jgi:hypothetical protein
VDWVKEKTWEKIERIWMGTNVILVWEYGWALGASRYTYWLVASVVLLGF